MRNIGSLTAWNFRVLNLKIHFGDIANIVFTQVAECTRSFLEYTCTRSSIHLLEGWGNAIDIRVTPRHSCNKLCELQELVYNELPTT